MNSISGCMGIKWDVEPVWLASSHFAMHTKIIQNHVVSISLRRIFPVFQATQVTCPAPPAPPPHLRHRARCRPRSYAVWQSRRAAARATRCGGPRWSGWCCRWRRWMAAPTGAARDEGIWGSRCGRGGNIVGTWFVLFWMEGDGSCWDVFGGEWNCMKLLWNKCGNFRMERLGNAVFEGLEKSRNVITLSQLWLCWILCGSELFQVDLEVRFPWRSWKQRWICSSQKTFSSPRTTTRSARHWRLGELESMQWVCPAAFRLVSRCKSSRSPSSETGVKGCPVHHYIYIYIYT